MKITEGLAEIKTLIKRIEKNREFIARNFVTTSNVVDPYAESGGLQKKVSETIQATTDLMKRIVKIRSAINTANATNRIKIGDYEQTIGEWLIWRRDILPLLRDWERFLLQNLEQAKTHTLPANWVEQKVQLIISVDEKEITQYFTNILLTNEELDGKLSLANATIDLEL